MNIENLQAADIETTGLLEQMKKQANPKLHVFVRMPVNGEGVHVYEGKKDRKRLQEYFDTNPILVMHNGILFDGEALKLLGYDISGVKIIDSLALSWYLEPDRIKHGLAEYGEEFGVPKPPIDDWENLTQEEYNHRCIEDVKIQKRLWKRQVARLTSLCTEKSGFNQAMFDRTINFLMHKMEELRQTQENKWTLDVEEAIRLQGRLAEKIKEKTEHLRIAMPKKAVSVVRSRPAKPFKKNGDLSAAGLRWKELTEKNNLPFEHTEDIVEILEWVDGNPASHQQIKDWLFSLGWEPATHKFVRDSDGTGRNIPQVNLKGGEVCESVKDLIKEGNGVEHIAGLGILNHRHSVVNGFLRDQIDGELIAGAGGFTNTLRLQHREIVNLPSLRVDYGEELRGLLIARPGKVLLGSDLSSLEDRLKLGFQVPLDPEYVKSQLSKTFDPHMTIAVIAKLLTQDEYDFYQAYKAGDEEAMNNIFPNVVDKEVEFKRIDKIRAIGKSTTYASQYGAGVKTIARTAKVDEKVAAALHAAYWEMNWSIKEIAASTYVKQTPFGEWQYNPISKMYYSLRTEKDRFSTLIQGSGAFILDLWLTYVEKLAEIRGLPYVLLGQFHDEIILELDEGMEEEYHKLVADALQKVNDRLKLNRELACDINFGKKYSDIH